MKYSIIFSIFLIFGQSFAQETLKIMSFNAHNLFDTYNDPLTKDEDFTPRGSQLWTKMVLHDKMKNIAEVILKEMPDVVGFSEIENSLVLKELVERELKSSGYHYYYAGPSEDSRGIRCAVISRLPILNTESYNVNRDDWLLIGTGKSKTRDILRVDFDTGKKGAAKTLTVLVNHWPSKLGGEKAQRMRADVAQSMSQITAKIAKRYTGRRVVSLGDFNDDITEKSFDKVPQVKLYSKMKSSAAGVFYSPSRELLSKSPLDRGTYYYSRKLQWQTIDHMFIAGGVLLNSKRSKGFHYEPGSFRIVRHRHAVNRYFPIGCNITYEDRKEAKLRKRCYKGASDHWPIVAEFKYQ